MSTPYVIILSDYEDEFKQSSAAIKIHGLPSNMSISDDTEETFKDKSMETEQNVYELDPEHDPYEKELSKDEQEKPIHTPITPTPPATYGIHPMENHLNSIDGHYHYYRARC
nr:hypothetical protein [Tanacetum cinerariifolium]